MRKFEYVIVPINFESPENTEVQLNSFGRTGWDLFYINTETGHAIFKRYIPAEKKEKKVLSG